MRILIISAEVWRDDTNGGNVLSNMFNGFNAEFAQIFCNAGTPYNGLCENYYQMTAEQAIKNFFTHKPIGKRLVFDDFPNALQNTEKSVVNKRKSFVYRHKWGIFYTLQDLVWNASNWKNQGLKNFIDDFNPDIIFAPCYGNKFMLKLTRFVARYTKKKVISYISDDSYSLKQFHLSPLYWIRRFGVRRQLRKTFPYYSLVYTMTEAQKLQCERHFNANMKILRKSNPFGDIPLKTEVNNPIKFIYAGGIYCNRWKTLKAVAYALREINKDEVKAVLDIYTSSDVPTKIDKYLNDGRNSYIKGLVSQTELREIYANSDVALHVESFDLKNRLAVRMSFSTKIIDCLASGCAVMAICDKKQGGYLYLKEEDAAICVSSLDKIKDVVRDIVDNPSKIIEYQHKAKVCCERNHDTKENGEMILKDFYGVLDGENITD